jgi:hypothetical protein
MRIICPVGNVDEDPIVLRSWLWLTCAPAGTTTDSNKKCDETSQK